MAESGITTLLFLHIITIQIMTTTCQDYGPPPDYGAPPGTDYGAPPGTAPDYGAPPGTEPDQGAPPGTEPDQGAPPGTEPGQGAPPGTEPDQGAPPGTEPDQGAPPGTAPDYGAPPGTEPDYGAPPGTEPDQGAPPGTEPDTGAPPGTAPDQGAPPGTDNDYGEAPEAADYNDYGGTGATEDNLLIDCGDSQTSPMSVTYNGDAYTVYTLSGSARACIATFTAPVSWRFEDVRTDECGIQIDEEAEVFHVEIIVQEGYLRRETDPKLVAQCPFTQALVDVPAQNATVERGLGGWSTTFMAVAGLTTGAVTLEVQDLTGAAVNSTHLGQVVRLRAQLSSPVQAGEASFRVWHCKLVEELNNENATAFVFLKAGCGEGSIIHSYHGFRTSPPDVSDGRLLVTAVSPLLRVVHLGETDGFHVDCDFIICPNADFCTGSSCVEGVSGSKLRRRRRRAAVGNVGAQGKLPDTRDLTRMDETESADEADEDEDNEDVTNTDGEDELTRDLDDYHYVDDDDAVPTATDETEADNGDVSDQNGSSVPDDDEEEDAAVEGGGGGEEGGKDGDEDVSSYITGETQIIRIIRPGQTVAEQSVDPVEMAVNGTDLRLGNGSRSSTDEEDTGEPAGGEEEGEVDGNLWLSVITGLLGVIALMAVIGAAALVYVVHKRRKNDGQATLYSTRLSETLNSSHEGTNRSLLHAPGPFEIGDSGDDLDSLANSLHHAGPGSQRSRDHREATHSFTPSGSMKRNLYPTSSSGTPGTRCDFDPLDGMSPDDSPCELHAHLARRPASRHELPSQRPQNFHGSPPDRVPPHYNELDRRACGVHGRGAPVATTRCPDHDAPYYDINDSNPACDIHGHATQHLNPPASCPHGHHHSNMASSHQPLFAPQQRI